MSCGGGAIAGESSVVSIGGVRALARGAADAVVSIANVGYFTQHCNANPLWLEHIVESDRPSLYKVS